MNEKHTLVLIYNSFKDPLFQNLILKYISKLAENPQLKFHLITFEQPQFQMSPQEILVAKKNLETLGIFWIPLKFHSGRLILFKKAWDLIQVFKVTFALRIKYKLSFLLAFANVSAALCSVLTIIFRLRLVIYSYEPHAKFMIDMGHWQSTDLKYKVLNFFEQLAAKKAYHIMTGTHAMKSEILTYAKNPKISVAPTAVDPLDFYFSQSERSLIRQKLEATQKKIILYIGKLGGLYYEKEIISLMYQISQWDERILPLIITDYDHQKIKEYIAECGLKHQNFILMKSIGREEVSAYLSAADLGIIGIPPLPNQKFRSPTKTAEFMLCDLPILICEGISEDSAYIKKYNLGCTVNSFSYHDVLSKKESILNMINADRNSFLNKGRNIAMEYRSIEKVHAIFNKIYQIE